jgi:hypothetical protein
MRQGSKVAFVGLALVLFVAGVFTGTWFLGASGATNGSATKLGGTSRDLSSASRQLHELSHQLDALTTRVKAIEDSLVVRVQDAATNVSENAALTLGKRIDVLEKRLAAISDKPKADDQTTKSPEVPDQARKSPVASFLFGQL